MKTRKPGRHSSHGNHDHQCLNCLPNFDHKVLPVHEVMSAKVNNDEIFSLKVYAAAFHIAMQEFTGSPLSAEALALLGQCTDEIGRGHTVSFVIEVRTAWIMQTDRRELTRLDRLDQGDQLGLKGSVTSNRRCFKRTENRPRRSVARQSHHAAAGTGISNKQSLCDRQLSVTRKEMGSDRGSYAPGA